MPSPGGIVAHAPWSIPASHRPSQMRVYRSIMDRIFARLRTRRVQLASPSSSRPTSAAAAAHFPPRGSLARSCAGSLEHICNPRSSLRNVFMQLRKACNHPLLLEDGSDMEQTRRDQAQVHGRVFDTAGSSLDGSA